MIKLICLDINQTLIEEDSWRQLNLALGLTREEDQEWLDLYRQGRLSYADWIEKLTDIYRERGRATFENVSRAVGEYSYKPGAREAIDYLKREGYKLALISGGMNVLVDKIANDLDIKDSRANSTFIFGKDGLLEKVRFVDDEPAAKLRHLEDFCRESDLNFAECAAVGDGANDAEIFRATGHGVTFRGSPIEKIAWRVIDRLEDLKKIF